MSQLTTGRQVLLRVLLAAVVCVAFSVGPSFAWATSTRVLVDPLRFGVVNVNRSQLSCGSDGRAYTLVGHLTALPGRMRGHGPTVLLVHDVDHSESFWRYHPGSPRDFSLALAHRGLRVVTIDRLGYGASPHPPGDATCLGAQADMVHQVLVHLRTGQYKLGSRRGPVVSHLGLVADGAGGALAELATYSWPRDAAALALMSWSDPGASTTAALSTLKAVTSCETGGIPSQGAPGYAYFATSGAEYRQDFLFGAPAPVQAGVAALREPDPCGDYRSLVALDATDLVHASAIRQPVLLLYGHHDPLLSAQAAQQQQNLLRSSSGVETQTFPRSSGDLTEDGDYLAVQTSTVGWLCARLSGCRAR